MDNTTTRRTLPPKLSPTHLEELTIGSGLARETIHTAGIPSKGVCPNPVVLLSPSCPECGGQLVELEDPPLYCPHCNWGPSIIDYRPSCLGCSNSDC